MSDDPQGLFLTGDGAKHFEFKIDTRRHIVQLAAGQTTVFALCDDGTVWERKERWPGRWDRLPEIPQEER